MLRDGDFYQITRDHTLVQSLVDEGRLTPEAAATHPQRSLVVRALQSSTDAEPDLRMREAMLGDRYLLCSDGLSDVVTEQTLHKTLISYPDPEQAVLQLIDLAIRSGGPDNITCIVADVVDTVTGPVAPSDAAVLAGAAAAGDGRPRPLSDSPAGRAHLLTQDRSGAGDRHQASLGHTSVGQVRPGRATGRRRPAMPTAITGGTIPTTSSIDAGRRAPPALAGGHLDPGRAGPADRRRRLRRLAASPSSQYYVGSDGQQVIIYRGIDQSVAGLNLSSIFQRTGIPLSHVQGSLLSCPTAVGHPGRGPAHGAEHPPDLHLQAGRHRGGDLGEEQAQAVTGHRRARRPASVQDRPVQADSKPSNARQKKPTRPSPRPSLLPAAGGRVTGMSDVTSSRATFEAPAVPDGAVPMPRGRRRTELLMLAFAVVVVGFAYAAVGLRAERQGPAQPAGLHRRVRGHHARRARWPSAGSRPWADPLMLPLAALLNGLGVVMIYRLQESGRNGNPRQPDQHPDRQLGHDPAGLDRARRGRLHPGPGVHQASRGCCSATPTRWARSAWSCWPSRPLLPASLSSVQGAKVWIIVGGFEIQPGEFAKLALAVFFAGYLVAKRDVLALAGRRVLGIDLPRARDLGPVLIAWGASLLILIFETDIGTSALFFGLFVAMIYIATQRTSWLLIGFLLFLGGSYMASTLFSHVGARFTAWLHPFTIANLNCQLGAAHCVPSYQLAQGLYGLGFGGIFGTGLGHGQPFWTPLAQSDFIMTAFGEELGLTGLMAMLLIFGLLVAARPAGGHRGQGPVRQAAGRRPVVRAGPAGIRHRGRRDQADPADRHHHPVPVPGRLLAGRELGADRRCSCGSATPRASRRRSRSRTRA